jgi:hypothetical protein
MVGMESEFPLRLLKTPRGEEPRSGNSWQSRIHQARSLDVSYGWRERIGRLGWLTHERGRFDTGRVCG